MVFSFIVFLLLLNDIPRLVENVLRRSREDKVRNIDNDLVYFIRGFEMLPLKCSIVVVSTSCIHLDVEHRLNDFLRNQTQPSGMPKLLKNSNSNLYTRRNQ